ncbi:hypothetical protein [Flavobacterium sp. H122]|uniref:hypothetical protein n=1 Tax=Flavobacterium sp. H122 TaxID=2529860 RepID=UPI0010AA8DC4|nr:hypothetical protein [Flavobacterium sp. H122]
MKKIGVVITDGVGFRNFVLSDFLIKSQEQFEEVIVFSCLPESVYQNLNFKVKIVELEVFEESFYTWFFRKAKELAHLQKHKKDNFGITDNLNANYSKAKTPRGWTTRFLFPITSICNSENWILRWEKWQQLTFAKKNITKKYRKILKDFGPDVLFFTHQRPPFIAPLIHAAQKQKIKTASFIFSWDNLASKGRMAGSFDHYLVWSELMKKELLHFYTSIKENQVGVVGTPQFEPYILNRYGLDKLTFCSKFNLDLNKKTILFSCGDVSTSPNDTRYIEAIAEIIADGKLDEEVNFLVRTSPAETPERFNELAVKYPWISWNYPKWTQARSNHQENWSQRIPTVEDVSDLKSVLQYCDLCVNMLSTMSLDAMLFDKPVINTVFGNGINGLVNDQRFLNYAHIKKVLDSGAVTIAENEEELISAINQCLFTPDYKLNEQKGLLELQIGKPLEQTSKRIAQALRNC